MGATDQPRRGVALGGFMGAGKSTVGRALAARLGLPLVDTDVILAARFGPIPEQLRRDGEPVFRARERALVAEIADGPDAVVATGGGTWADGENRRHLARAFRTVVLVAAFEILAERVGSGAGRPLWSGAEDRLRARQPAYADAELHVDVAVRGPDEVVDHVVAGLEDPARGRRSVEIALGDRSYPVVLAPGGFRGLAGALAGRVHGRRVVVVTDSTVGPLWSGSLRRELEDGGFTVELLVHAAGERHKDLATWGRLVGELVALGIDRRTPVLALGGGVTGDLVGFAAATALRGVPFVQVPTTLLAMVDSSVGGKTGVNHPVGKNLIGAFHQPALVWAPMQSLTTLDPAERRAGLGEVVKTALIADAGLFERLERDAAAVRRGDLAVPRDVVGRCVEIKAAIVAADEREAGPRAVLNAGHTVGHAYETALGHGAPRHGEAVALGLIAETEWAVRRGVCADPDAPRRVRALVTRLGLPTTPPEADRARLLAAMRVDKKAKGDMLLLPVPSLVGQARLLELPVEDLDQLLPEPP